MKYCCILCNFSTNNKYNYNKHLNTKKHINKNKKFICECGKQYKYKTGLSKHKNKCILKTKLQDMKNEIACLKDKNRTMENNTNQILNIIKKSSENNTNLIEEVKKLKENKGTSLIQHQNIQNIQTQNNTINQNISINVFLNKHCQNAMNLKDFVENLQITFDDLVHTGKSNYVEGVSKILIKNLNKLNLLERPIHCSDVKRKVLYIKNEEGWEKDREHEKITKCIKDVEFKQIKKIPEWTKEKNIDIYKNDLEGMKYQKIIYNSMGGMNTEKREKNKKSVIKKLSKEMDYKKII